jgi:filamentous hemagglutinin family protein
MFLKSHFVFLATLLLTTTQLSAQIATDGTLGIKTNLTGPNFQIPDNLGQQFDGNLFHSFREFNINTGQSATFTGPNTVQNILTRVTGGQRSLIDGTLRSDIPNANLYLLNPSGILFGKNASLDISGSFHASTADYLRLADGSSFYARPDSNPALLSVARPEAFGFLSNRPTAIEIQGSILRVSEGKDLSLIGGDLTIQDSTLHAPGGRINLASVASSGEVIPKTGVEGAYLGVTGFKELGTVKLWQSMINPYDRPKVANSDVLIGNLDVSGDNAGQIFIRAGQLLANNAWVLADTHGDKSGLIDISVEGPISLTNSTRITAGNLGTAHQPGLINITTATKLFVGFKSEELDTVLSQPFVAEFLINEGFSSGMTITDLMRDGYFQQFFVTAVSSVIGTANFGEGIGGDIKITTPSLEVSYGLIETATAGSGKAGNIQINASQVNLYDYGFINAAVGFDPNIPESGSGYAGNIYLRDIDGINPVRLISLSNNSTISAGTDPDTSGDAGNIDLKTQELVLTNGAQINSHSEGIGNAGSINIKADTALLTNTSAIYTEADHAG